MQNLVSVAAILVALASYADAGAFSYNVTKFEVGSSGTWGPWDFCPYDTHATSFSMYFDSNNGATAISLKCNSHPTYKIASSGNRLFPETQSSSGCPSGLDGVQVKLDASVGIAETKFLCGNQSQNVPIPAGYNLPYAWTNIENCTAGQKICGIRTRLDAAVGITGVEFTCCEAVTTLDNTREIACGFESGLCDWTSQDWFQVEFIPGVASTGNITRFVFQNTSSILNRQYSNSGPAVASEGTKFVYYETFIDYYQQYRDSSLASVPREFYTHVYDGTFWRNPTFSFDFHAYGNSLGQLYMRVFDSNGTKIQDQLLYSQNIHDYISKSNDTWRSIKFPVASLLSGNDGRFQLKIVAENVGNFAHIQSGDFGLDDFKVEYAEAGNCVSPGCHHNATCTLAANLLTGFTCECHSDFIGDGSNQTDGCVFNDPCAITNLTCQANFEQNDCTFHSIGAYNCTCGEGFQLSADNSTCDDIDECANDPFTCGANTVCTNTVGNYTCDCAANHTGDPSNGHTNIICEPDGGWSEWSLPDGSCSVTCGGGVYNATRNCTNPSPSGFGANCTGASYNTSTCGDILCPDSCPVWKNCTACQNFTNFEENGPLNMALTYFNGLSAGDLTFAMTKMSQWNQTVIEKVCSSANCDVVVLNGSLSQLSVDINNISALISSTDAAKIDMRNILDCNAGNGTSHNEWLWDIFDKLCEYEAFLPNILEDLNIKMGLLSAERDRCANRSTMRQLIELMYRKW